MSRTRCLVGSGLTFLAATGMALSQQTERPERYRGPLRGYAVELAIDLGASNALASIRYELENAGDKAAPLGATYAGGLEKAKRAEERRSVGAGDRVRLAHTHRFAIEGTGLKQVRVDPLLELEGKRYLERFGVVEVRILMPAGVKSVMFSSLGEPRLSTDPASGRSVLRYTLNNKYLPPVVLKWHKDVQLTVTKTASRSKRRVEVAVTVSNAGTQPLTDLDISEDFDPEVVRDGKPSNEFALVEGEPNDRRLKWTKRINNIPAGQTVELAYRLELSKRDNSSFRLGRTTISRTDGELLAASQRVTPADN